MAPTDNGGRAVPVQARLLGEPRPCSGHGGPPDEARLQRAVLTMSVGFLGVFGGFQAAQGLQTSLNATLGSLNLACLYGAFTVLCLLAPAMLSRLERAMGIRVVMLLASLAYVAMVFSNILPPSSEPCAAWAVPLAANTIVGVAAPVLWTAQNAYVCRCATAAAVNCAEGREVFTTRFNSLFFAVYQFAGMCGNLLCSSILLALSGHDAATRILFLVLGCVSASGSLAFLRMPAVAAESGESNDGDNQAILATAQLALGDARTGLFIPLMFTNGMILAYFFGDFQARVTSPVLGPALTGLTIATFFGVNAIATRVWGQAVSTRRLSRRSAFVVATVVQAAFLAALLAWRAPVHFERQPAPGGVGWRRLGVASAADAAAVLGLAAVLACGDAFYESGPPATLQTFYAGSEKVVPAMANYKLWQSLGMAVQFPLSIAIGDLTSVAVVILLALLAVSIMCVLVLDAFVAPLHGEDPRASSAEQQRERA